MSPSTFDTREVYRVVGKETETELYVGEGSGGAMLPNPLKASPSLKGLFTGRITLTVCFRPAPLPLRKDTLCLTAHSQTPECQYVE